MRFHRLPTRWVRISTLKRLGKVKFIALSASGRSALGFTIDDDGGDKTRSLLRARFEENLRVMLFLSKQVEAANEMSKKRKMFFNFLLAETLLRGIIRREIIRQREEFFTRKHAENLRLKSRKTQFSPP
jgi:hypothetical protein